jgi:hypothetical protein
MRCAGGGCAPDSDGDGVCDLEDECPGFDDSLALSFTNPGFGSTSGWTLLGGTTVNSGSAGYMDPGYGSWGMSAVCAEGEIVQDVCVPGDFSTVGPLQFSFGGRMVTCTMGICSGEMNLTFEGHERKAGGGLFSTAFASETVCLGEAAYGGVVSMGWKADFTGTCISDAVYTFDVDNPSITTAPSGTCPAPGTVLNGDFTSDLAGWTAAGSGHVGIVTVGSNKQVNLYGRAGSCESPRIDGLVSIPLRSSMPNTALRLEMMGNSGTVFRIELKNGAQFQSRSYTATGAWETLIFCFEPTNQGVVLDLSLESAYPSGGCLSTPTRDFYLDDVVVISDSTSCP